MNDYDEFEDEVYDPFQKGAFLGAVAGVLIAAALVLLAFVGIYHWVTHDPTPASTGKDQSFSVVQPYCHYSFEKAYRGDNC